MCTRRVYADRLPLPPSEPSPMPVSDDHDDYPVSSYLPRACYSPLPSDMDFVGLFVSGDNSVTKLLAKYPTHQDRCRLALQLEHGHVLPSDFDYKVGLHTLPGCRLDACNLQLLLTKLLPGGAALHSTVYDVSDYLTSDTTVAMSSEQPRPRAPTPINLWDTPQLAPITPPRKRIRCMAAGSSTESSSGDSIQAPFAFNMRQLEEDISLRDPCKRRKQKRHWWRMADSPVLPLSNGPSRDFASPDVIKRLVFDNIELD